MCEVPPIKVQFSKRAGATEKKVRIELKNKRIEPAINKLYMYGTIICTLHRAPPVAMMCIQFCLPFLIAIIIVMIFE